MSYIPSIRVADKSDATALVRRIIAEIGRAALTAAAQPLVSHVKSVATEVYTKKLSEASGAEKERLTQDSASHTRTIRNDQFRTYSPSFPECGVVLEALVEDDGDAWSFLVESKSKAAEKWEIEAMDNDYQAVRVLGGLINFITYDLAEVPQTPGSRMVYLFIDEAENLTRMSAKEQLSLNWALRDLANYCPERLCMLLAATGSAADLFAFFDQAVQDRWSRAPLELGELDAAHAYQFVAELLEKYRANDGTTTPTHPFSEEATRLIIDRTASKTPRRLMRNFGIVLDAADREDGPVAKNGAIGEDDVEIGDLS